MKAYIPALILMLSAVSAVANENNMPPPPPHHNPEEMFARMDANKDGVLSKDEFMNFHKKMREMHGHMMDKGGMGGKMEMHKGEGPKINTPPASTHN